MRMSAGEFGTLPQDLCYAQQLMSHGYHTFTHAHLLFSPKEILHCRKNSANLLSDDSSGLNFSMQVERIPQCQQAENVAPDRHT